MVNSALIAALKGWVATAATSSSALCPAGTSQGPDHGLIAKRWLHSSAIRVHVGVTLEEGDVQGTGRQETKGLPRGLAGCLRNGGRGDAKYGARGSHTAWAASKSGRVESFDEMMHLDQ
jgi:hypothetical protein